MGAPPPPPPPPTPPAPPPPSPLPPRQAIKKMSKTNAKSLNGMKQNLKKKMAEHETKLAEVKKAGGLDDDDDSDDESESESDSDSDSDSSSDSDSDTGRSKWLLESAPVPLGTRRGCSSLLRIRQSAQNDCSRSLFERAGLCDTALCTNKIEARWRNRRQQLDTYA